MLVLAGAAVGALVSRTLCGTLWNIRARVNGAPFQRGDCVQILTGLHRGRVARVYEVWGERNQVRVELGEQEKSETKDVFPHLEVFRERAS